MEIVIKHGCTYEEYMQMEQASDRCHEFWDDVVFAIRGQSIRHNLIIQHLYSAMRLHFKPTCSIFCMSVKLEQEEHKCYFYPDLQMTCDEADDDPYIVRRPVLIAEVLSPQTAVYDAGIKLQRYTKIKSLRYYLLVSQAQPYVEIFGRNSEHELFTYDVAEGLDAVVHMPTIEFELPLSKVYEYIEFPPQEPISSILKK